MTNASPPKKTAISTAADYAVPLRAKEPLSLPAGVKPFRCNWPYVLVVGAYHMAALLPFMPGYFSWGGFVIALLGTHLCGLFGINLCYHRLLIVEVTAQGLV